MAEARDVSVNREFIVSGFLSGQAYRLAVRVDSAAARLIRLGLRDFDKAKALEADVFSALSDLDATTKAVRKLIDKVNRRRREGVPSSGPKQTFMVRSLPSAHAFRCAVAVDQIQRDISMLGLASSGDVAKTAAEAQATLTEAINIADSVIQSVIKKTDARRPAKPSAPKGGKGASAPAKPATAKSEPAKKPSAKPKADGKAADVVPAQKAKPSAEKKAAVEEVGKTKASKDSPKKTKAAASA